MNLTQAQLSAAIDKASVKYKGQKVADQAGGYPGECLSLVKKIYGDDILHVQMPGAVNGYAWGDGYYKYFSQSLPLPTHFKKEVYVPGKNYPKGSLVIYAPTHHIAIWLKDNDNGTHTVLEQNADPDHSPTHISVRANSRVTGILTPRVKAPPATGGTAKVIREANVRSAPKTSAPLSGSKVLKPGETFKYVSKVKGQDINQNGVHTNLWYKSVKGNYIWSGNAKG